MKMRKSLFRKYLGVLAGLIVGTLILASAVQLVLNARAQRDRVGEVLGSESRLAAMQIQSFLSNIVASMGWVLDYDQPGQDADLDAIRDESQRLLRKAAAIVQLRYVNGDGCERIVVSRVDTDRREACAALSASDLALVQAAHAHQVAYGTVLFRDGSEPYMDVALAARGRAGGVLFAQVDLRQIHDTVTGIHIGRTGFAYVLDQSWHLVAHPDESLVLRHLDLRDSTVVRDALGAGQQGAPQRQAMLSTDMDERRVLSALAPVAGPNWWVFVQQPAREAFAPIVASLWAAALVVLAAIAGAVGASYVLARRMASPIQALRAGAENIGAGDLGARITIDSGDEVELLAAEFNRMAEALGQSYAGLEAKVQQRTFALAEAGAQVQRQASELAEVNAELSVRLDELAVRKDEAERASAAKTRFLAAASHDLMQPMHAVGLLVGILRRRIHVPEVSALVVKVQAAVQGMETLFGSLLDISKLDSGAVKVDMRTMALQDLLGFIEVNYQPLAQEKGITLRVARCRAAVLTDPGLLDRIIGNLVTNAIRYTASGSVLVGCRRVGKAMRVEVWDTGMGIAKQYQAQIFEEFFQLENPDRDRGNGLGLGLSIVKRSAELLGHRLTLRSEPGRGSVFGIELPCVPNNAAADPAHGSSEPAEEWLRGAFVVVVDDDGDQRFALEHLLHLWGCHVIASSSLVDVLDQLTSHLRPPDLILTDYRLGPALTGLAVIDGIRDVTGELTPAVIVTGESAAPATASLPEHCVVLRKPAGPARLFEVCTAMLAPRELEAG
jgi:signal transduction histidine kinase/CheY-like chemotaxis protein